jgi:terminase small subunit-like protein
MRRLAFPNVQDFYHEDGTLKPMHELTREHGSALAQVEVVLKNVTVGDGHIESVYRIRLHDKLKALEMLAKHLALLTDRVEHAVRPELIKMLEDGRRRNAEAEANSSEQCQPHEPRLCEACRQAF